MFQPFSTSSFFKHRLHLPPGGMSRTVRIKSISCGVAAMAWRRSWILWDLTTIKLGILWDLMVI